MLIYDNLCQHNIRTDRQIDKHIVWNLTKVMFNVTKI
jgi:hypothetical protein